MLLSLLSGMLVLSIRAQQDIALKVTRAVWGQNLNAPIEAYPGDTGVALTVEVQNLSPNRTIKGVSGSLFLETGPFTDIYGNLNTTATGVPTIGEILNPTDEIKPKGFLTLTYTLDVSEDAVPQSYTLSMTVTYSASDGVDFVEATPQILYVNCQVSRNESTITISASPATLNTGETVRITGNIQPPRDNVSVTLIYRSPDQSSLVQSAKTQIDGSFSDSFVPTVEGFWGVNATSAGDDKYSSSWSSTTFEVRLKVSLEANAANNRLKAGYDNQLNITVKNDGQVPYTALDFSFTIPAPLVITGKSQWTLNKLDAGDSFVIPVQIFVPSTSLGSTYSGAFAATCTDDYGASQTYNIAVGLIIVGNVELVVSDSVVKPQPATNGSRIEITTTLLNRGTVTARYVNATIVPDNFLVFTSESTVYVGDVEENSQSPFTLSANLSNTAEDGTYPIVIRITYRDDQNIDNSFEVTSYLSVDSNASLYPVETAGGGILEVLSELGLIIAIVVLATLAMIFTYQKRHRKSKKQIGLAK